MSSTCHKYSQLIMVHSYNFINWPVTKCLADPSLNKCFCMYSWAITNIKPLHAYQIIIVTIKQERFPCNICMGSLMCIHCTSNSLEYCMSVSHSITTCPLLLTCYSVCIHTMAYGWLATKDTELTDSLDKHNMTMNVNAQAQEANLGWGEVTIMLFLHQGSDTLK